MVLLQGILREPPSSFSVVHSGAVVRERQACERLILLTVEVVPIVRNWQRCRVPAFSERIVVVAFENLAPRIYDRAHAAQMIRQEIVYFRPPAVVRADDPAVVERGALECVYGSIIRRIYQRTNIECLLTIIILVPACSSIRKIFKKWE